MANFKKQVIASKILSPYHTYLVDQFKTEDLEMLGKLMELIPSDQRRNPFRAFDTFRNFLILYLLSEIPDDPRLTRGDIIGFLSRYPFYEQISINIEYAGNRKTPEDFDIEIVQNRRSHLSKDSQIFLSNLVTELNDDFTYQLEGKTDFLNFLNAIIQSPDNWVSQVTHRLYNDILASEKTNYYVMKDPEGIIRRYMF